LAKATGPEPRRKISPMSDESILNRSGTDFRYRGAKRALPEPRRNGVSDCFGHAATDV
jgi:hypothetical protein